MSTTFQYMACQGDLTGVDLPTGFHPLGEGTDGWSFLEVEPPVALDRLEEGMRAIVQKTRQSAVACYVETSDFGYVVAASADGIGARLIFGTDAAADLCEGQWALSACEQQGAGKEWTRAAAARMTDWSKSAPKQVTVGTLLWFLRQDWDFPEEAVARLFDRLKLPLPDPISKLYAKCEGVRLLLLGKSIVIDGQSIDTEEQRYIVGFGDGFIGIWDSEHRGSPISRYAPTELSEAMYEWRRLHLGE